MRMCKYIAILYIYKKQRRCLNHIRKVLKFMKEYNYKDIKEITKSHVLFKDGFDMLFEECINEFSVVHNLTRGGSRCVAKRDCLETPPYFLFYSKERVKVFFDFKGPFKNERILNKFMELQMLLDEYGYTTFDLT